MKIKKYKKHIEYVFVSLILLAVGISYISLLSNLSDNFHPVWSDEFLYFMNARSAFINETLQAAFTFNGTGSPVFGADAHGFGYPLWHSLFAKVLGWNNLNFIKINFVLILSALILVWTIQSVTRIQKLSITTLVLLFPFFPLYGFTFMQEVIHLFFGIILSINLYLINHKSNQKRYFISFILLILLAGMFRGLWFFWLIALIPFANSRRQFLIFLLILFTGILVAYLFNKFFTEPVPNYFNSLMNSLKKGNFIDIFTALFFHFIENIKLYFFSGNSSLIYYAMKIIIFGIVLYFTYFAVTKKSKIHKALTLVGLINFILLFALYDASDWREIRTMAPLFYFFVLFLVLESKSSINYILILLLIVLFIPTLKISAEWMNERNLQLPMEPLERQSYQQLAQKIPDQKVVLINYLPNNNLLNLMQLPLQNLNKKQIKYIIPLYIVQNRHYDYIMNAPAIRTKQKSIMDNTFFSLQEK